MSKYRIQLKQGKRTIVAHGEYKDVDAVKNHYDKISTMKVTEVLKVEYEYTGSNIPIDDFEYLSQFKGIVKNDSSRKSKQVVFNNIKPSISSKDILSSVKETMELDGLKIDSMICTLFKS